MKDGNFVVVTSEKLNLLQLLNFFMVNFVLLSFKYQFKASLLVKSYLAKSLDQVSSFSLYLSHI